MPEQHTPTGHLMLQVFQRAALWIGLALCLFAAWKLLADVQGLDVPGPASIGALLALLLLAWACVVAGWRLLVQAFLGEPLPWITALRQSGLLLIGKYIPGGIFGLLARATDPTGGHSHARLLGVGIYEQVGTITLVGTNGLVLVASAMVNLRLLVLLPLVPLAPVAAILVLHRLLRRMTLPRMLQAVEQVQELQPSAGRLARSMYVTHVSALAWSAIVAWLAVDLFSQPPIDALGLGGAFGLAITAGALAFFAPGGIGVREMSMAGLATLWLPMQQALALAALLRLLAVILDIAAGVSAVLLPNRQAPLHTGQ